MKTGTLILIHNAIKDNRRDLIIELINQYGNEFWADYAHYLNKTYPENNFVDYQLKFSYYVLLTTLFFDSKFSGD